MSKDDVVDLLSSEPQKQGIDRISISTNYHHLALNSPSTTNQSAFNHFKNETLNLPDSFFSPSGLLQIEKSCLQKPQQIKCNSDFTQQIRELEEKANKLKEYSTNNNSICMSPNPLQMCNFKMDNFNKSHSLEVFKPSLCHVVTNNYAPLEKNNFDSASFGSLNFFNEKSSIIFPNIQQQANNLTDIKNEENYLKQMKY